MQQEEEARKNNANKVQGSQPANKEEDLALLHREGNPLRGSAGGHRRLALPLCVVVSVFLVLVLPSCHTWGWRSRVGTILHWLAVS